MRHRELGGAIAQQISPSNWDERCGRGNSRINKSGGIGVLPLAADSLFLRTDPGEPGARLQRSKNDLSPFAHRVKRALHARHHPRNSEPTIFRPPWRYGHTR